MLLFSVVATVLTALLEISDDNRQLRLGPDATRFMTDVEITDNGIKAHYYETERERILHFEHGETIAAIVQNTDGYAMVTVRTTPMGDELERYYGFDMALDHVAERLAVPLHTLPVPAEATDMGM